MGSEEKERWGKEEGKGWVESLAERTEISIQGQLGVQNYLRMHPQRHNRVLEKQHNVRHCSVPWRQSLGN